MSADASARGTAIDRLAALPDRGKAPVSARVLETWVAQAQPRVGVDAGRLGWLIASTVVIAALQCDGLEKFYGPAEWMRYVIDHFLRPGAIASGSGVPCFDGFTFDHSCNGVVAGARRDTGEVFDRGAGQLGHPAGARPGRGGGLVGGACLPSRDRPNAPGGGAGERRTSGTAEVVIAGLDVMAANGGSAHG